MEDDSETKDKEPVIIAPMVELEKKEPNPIVRHTLDLDEVEEEITSAEKVVVEKPKTSDKPKDITLIPTSEFIKTWMWYMKRLKQE